MKLRDLKKLNSCNDGTRTLGESIAVPEVGQALKDWIKNTNTQAVLIGGLAVSYYIKPRATMDVDYLFIVDEIPTTVTGFKRTRNGAFQHNKTHVEIEVVTPSNINVPDRVCREVLATASKIDNTLVASPSGLIALKLHRANYQDKSDIFNLSQNNNIDISNFGLTPEQIVLYNEIINI